VQTVSPEGGWHEPVVDTDCRGLPPVTGPMATSQ
jgi:hypothetical protein